MADWRDRFRQGSFRGVQFKTDSHSFSGGRRKVDHEFPQRDVSRSEDLGRKIRQFQLELLVIGDDYFTQRDNLIEALEKEGPGELVHPYLGRKSVQVGGFSLNETVSEGRLARFSVSFSEAGEIKFPDISDSGLEKTSATAELLKDKGKNFFEQAFDTLNQAAFVIQGAADSVAATVDFLEDTVATVTAPIANITFAISNLKADLSDLVKAPGELADRLKGVFDDLLSEFEDDPKIAANIFGAFVGLGDVIEPVVGNTPSKARILQNNNAIVNYTKIVAFSSQTQAAVEIDFDSVREAVTLRDSIITNLDEQADIAEDDDLFQTLKDTQAGLASTLPPVDAGEIITFTPKKTLPALVIAHTLFQDLDKELEIINENDIAHPGFVPGGSLIEVSSG